MAYTPALRLNIPVFDQDPWDYDVNSNWSIIDAAVGTFTAIPNMTGVWKNSTTYLAGQATVDPSTATIWVCAIGHVSSAPPATFASDRAAYPSNWVQSTTGGLYLPISGGTINGDLNVLGAVTSGADIISKGGLFVNDTAVGMVFAPLGTARLMQFAPTYTWSWNAADANLTYLSNSTIHLVVNNTDQQFGNELAGMYGHGIYNNVSDERVKVDIQPTTYGLAEIMQLEPIAFKRKAAGRVEDGFSAQQVQKIIPSAVTTIAATADRAELLGVGLDPIVAALVNGMKEQDARIRELEKQLSDMHGGNRPAQPE